MQQLQDLKHALRIFREAPLFTATVVAAMALGIGVNTAIFSVVNAVLLKPLPFSDPATLVAVENTRNGTPYGPWTSPSLFMYWRAQTGVFSDVAAISQIPLRLNYTGGDTPEQITASRVSESYFRVLRVPMFRGRPFTAREDRPGGAKVAVISYDFWQRHLGGAPNAVGKMLALNGDSYAIVGIMGRGFRDTDPYFDAASFSQPDLLVPFQLDPNTRIEANYFNNIARLKPGVTLAEAQARIAASVAGFRQRFPDMPKELGFSVLSARQAITSMYGDPRARLWVLLAAVGVVLLIACANVASLLLVRAIGRAHEIAIRSALGAGRGHIVRLLLTESLLLSLTGGLVGLFAGFLGIRALLAVNTAGFPRLGAEGSMVGMDWRVVAFTVGLSLATGLVFGLVPALAGSRSDLNTVIKASSAGSSNGLRQNKTRSVLVTVEVGLAAVLLIGAGLLIHTSLALGRVDLGFDPTHVFTMSTTFGGSRFQTARSITPTARTALERVRSIPGVENAALTCCVPLQGAVGLSFGFVGRSGGPATGGARYVMSSEGYFAAFGIPVLRGRAFAARDDEAGAAPVAIINQAMAKRYWSNGRDPLQKRIVVGAGIKELSGGPVRRIIGIVGDVRYDNLETRPEPTIYVPVAQTANSVFRLVSNVGVGTTLTWVVRTRENSVTLAATIQKSIREATGLPAVNVEPMDRLLSTSVSRQRLNMLLMSIFGGAALLLAAIGIYGLLAYSVQQRVQEIGIRMALGADAGRVKGMVVRQGMILVAIGIAAGLVAAFYTARVLASWLFEVKPRDPVVFVAVPVVLALIALVSVWLPARRASRVNPLDALRYE